MAVGLLPLPLTERLPPLTVSEPPVTAPAKVLPADGVV